MSVADAHGAEASWTSWLPLCCMPLNSSDNKAGRKSSLNTISTGGHGESWPLGRSSDEELLMDKDEKPTREGVICDQPLHHPRPTPAPEMSFHQRTMAEKAARNNTAPKKRRFLSISSTSDKHKSHRPTISAPTHFRHISTGSPQFTFPESRAKSKTKAHRPTISAPSHFRHVSTGSPFSEPMPTMPPMPPMPTQPAKLRRRRSFRPLELSIYLPENKTSPIMSHFMNENRLQSPAPVYDPRRAEKESQSEAVPPSPRAPKRTEKLVDTELETSPSPAPPVRPFTHRRRSASTSDLTSSDQSTNGSRPLEHHRSFSAMSFHFPRKAVLETTSGSHSTIYEDDMPPLIPPKARGRARAYTSPNVEAIKERVASAMIEAEQLQKQIDDVLERQSLYSVSRPSTSHSAANTMPELEPMPSIPALPPAAPSFAERLNSEIERPRTAPIKSHVLHRRARTMDNTPPRPHTPPMRKARRSDIPLPPPLPLVLRPPLRKKKSFSRVSTWLFPGGENNTDHPMDSVTNDPRPVTGKEGFYQCVSLVDSHGRRHSDESLGTVTAWNSDDDRTAPSAWSPTSTAVTKGDEQLVPRAVFASENNMSSPLVSVGIAV